MTKLKYPALVALLLAMTLLPVSVKAASSGTTPTPAGVVSSGTHDDNTGGLPQSYTVTTTTLGWHVISSGGTQATIGTDKILLGTVVQTAIGEVSSPNYIVHQGFWQNFGPTCRSGDVNGDGLISIADAVYIINYIFGSGPDPKQGCSADYNGDGLVSIGDAVAILNLLFFH